MRSLPVLLFFAFLAPAPLLGQGKYLDPDQHGVSFSGTATFVSAGESDERFLSNTSQEAFAWGGTAAYSFEKGDVGVFGSYTAATENLPKQGIYGAFATMYISKQGGKTQFTSYFLSSVAGARTTRSTEVLILLSLNLSRAFRLNPTFALHPEVSVTHSFVSGGETVQGAGFSLGIANGRYHQFILEPAVSLNKETVSFGISAGALFRLP